MANTFANLTTMNLLNMTVDKTTKVFNVGNNVITDLSMNSQPADKDAVNFKALKDQIGLNLSPINSSIATLDNNVINLRTDVDNITEVLGSTTDTATLASKLAEIGQIIETWDSSGSDLLGYISSIAKEEVKISTFSTKSILLNPLSTAINTNGVTLSPVTNPAIPIGGCYYTHGANTDLCLKFPVQERIFLSNASYMSCLLYLKNVTNLVQPKFSFNVKTLTTNSSGIDITPAISKTYTYDAIPSISADGVYQFYTNINNVANFDASLNILNILTYSKYKLTQTTPIVCEPEKEYITEINLTIKTDAVLDYVIGNTILQYNNSSFNL